MKGWLCRQYAGSAPHAPIATHPSNETRWGSAQANRFRSIVTLDLLIHTTKWSIVGRPAKGKPGCYYQMYLACVALPMAGFAIRV